MSSSILFENEEKTVVLLDLPRSLEEAQFPDEAQDLPETAAAADFAADTRKLNKRRTTRRLVSSRPPDHPFAIPEPKQPQPNVQSPSAQVAGLMTLAAVEEALRVIREEHSGPWLLPRVVATSTPPCPGKKRKIFHAPETEDGGPDCDAQVSALEEVEAGESDFFRPCGSQYVKGSIESTRRAFLRDDDDAPPPQPFDLIVLDPPWPNRSARRKKRKDHYRTAYGTDEIRRLLCQVPVASLLASGGLVAVWVTNRPAFAEMLTCPRSGVFASEWGVEPVGTWTWLKVTTRGEPVFPLESEFRKPWEQLLIGRRRKVSAPPPSPAWLDRRVVVSVPDAHSRKPSLRGLFGQVLPPGFRGLEVFARNLTAGWWSWGDDVLRFQGPGHWAKETTNGVPDGAGSVKEDAGDAESQK